MPRAGSRLHIQAEVKKFPISSLRVRTRSSQTFLSSSLPFIRRSVSCPAFQSVPTCSLARSVWWPVGARSGCISPPRAPREDPHLTGSLRLSLCGRVFLLIYAFLFSSSGCNWLQINPTSANSLLSLAARARRLLAAADVKLAHVKRVMLTGP